MKDKKNGTVYCDSCYGEIEYKHDIVMALNLFKVDTYHNKCYAEALMDGRSFTLSNEPINGTMGKVGVIFSLIASGFFLFSGAEWISFALLFVPLMRFYTWFKYEKGLR